jgi:leucine dehydrogenase
MFDEMVSTEHEQVLHCHDPRTGLRAIIALHDTRPGLAMGATRLYPYESHDSALRDVLRLSRGMTYKAAAADLPVGGGKAVIMAPPEGKSEALLLAYARFIERLEGRFITGQDVNITLDDVRTMARETAYVVGTRALAGGPALSTAIGVVAGIEAACLRVLGSACLEQLTVAVQGLGSVGALVCELLHSKGARLIVCDTDPAKVESIRRLGDVAVVSPQEIYDARADVFAPCAMGAVLHRGTIPRLRARIVAGSANNQLAQEMEDAVRLRQREIVYCPDFVINAGGLVNVYTELRGGTQAELETRLQVIARTLDDIFELASGHGITTAAAAHALVESRRRVIPSAQGRRSGTATRAEPAEWAGGLEHRTV